MSTLEYSHEPFAFDSPVEFVLIAVTGRTRSVVAKSKGAQMDLVAYAQRSGDDDDGRPYVSPLFPFPFPAPMRLHPIAIDSPPAFFRTNIATDPRASQCTLVWRGTAYASEQMAIKEEFYNRVEDIVSSFEQRAAGQLEWTLAPIIDRCYRATEYSRARRLWLVYAFWFTLLVYAIVIISAVISYSILR